MITANSIVYDVEAFTILQKVFDWDLYRISEFHTLPWIPTVVFHRYRLVSKELLLYAYSQVSLAILS